MVGRNNYQPLRDKLLTPEHSATSNVGNSNSNQFQHNSNSSLNSLSGSSSADNLNVIHTDQSSEQLNRSRDGSQLGPYQTENEYSSTRSHISSNDSSRRSTIIGNPFYVSSPYLPLPVGGTVPRATLPLSDDHYLPSGATRRQHDSNSLYPSTAPSIVHSSAESFQESGRHGHSSVDLENSGNTIFDDSYYFPFGGFPQSDFLLSMEEKEDDDYIHNPDPEADALLDKKFAWDRRTIVNASGFAVLMLGLLIIMVVLPVFTYSNIGKKHPTLEILTEYSYPLLSGIRTDLVDPDTPESAHTRTAKDGSEWKLVFSDEFNEEGRTFYPGDSQFWEAPDIHYQATVDLDWYDPDAVTTTKGSLQLRYDAFENHDLNYRSGMLQSWNKMCFTQGIMEVSASLPGSSKASGIWPGIWSMGNLARPGYLASSDGVWPYSYDSCDAGITPNQSSHDGLSFLPGQRLNKCTCTGADHPNPGVGRGAPELDAVEASVNNELGIGITTQSVQMAPYNIYYMPDYDFVEIHNLSITSMNSWPGGPFQQALVGTSMLNPEWQEFLDATATPQAQRTFQNYGFEYLNDDTNGYVQFFIGDKPTYTVYADTFHADGNIDTRLLTKEPMSIILNFGMSLSWAYIDWANIMFPMTMLINSVRIYQPPDQISVTCDPPDFPTYNYIQNHLPAYFNANNTSWEMAGYKFPKNKLTGC